MNLKSIYNFAARVSEHNRFNSTQGIVYSNYLRGVQGAPQRIIKVEKVLRLSDNAPSETGQITGLFRLFDCAAASWLCDLRPYSPGLISRTYVWLLACCDWPPRAALAPSFYRPQGSRYFPFCGRPAGLRGPVSSRCVVFVLVKVRTVTVWPPCPWPAWVPGPVR